MSTLRVQTITNFADDGAPTFEKGLIVGEGVTITGNIDVTGVATIGYLVGDGNALTNTPGVLAGKAIGMMLTL